LVPRILADPGDYNLQLGFFCQDEGDRCVSIWAQMLKRGLSTPEAALQTTAFFAKTVGGMLLSGEIGTGPQDPMRRYFSSE
jgi:hypothetical protein